MLYPLRLSFRLCPSSAYGADQDSHRSPSIAMDKKSSLREWRTYLGTRRQQGDSEAAIMRHIKLCHSQGKRDLLVHRRAETSTSVLDFLLIIVASFFLSANCISL
jgi:hypothetical protein